MSRTRESGGGGVSIRSLIIINVKVIDNVPFLDLRLLEILTTRPMAINQAE